MMVVSSGTNLYKLSTVSEEVTIGQGKTGQFSPRLNLSCFKGLAQLVLIPQLSGKFTPTVKGEELSISNPVYEMIVKSTPVSSFNQFGGLDLIITLKSKPSTNKVSFGYDTSILRPCFQPALTVKEISMGDLRPDHVVNSIAWYHATKGLMVTPDDVANRITSGKAFHQYRMKIIASDGSWIWADWELSPGNLVTLVVDQTFLDTKPYPMVIAPVSDTFGWTTAGASAVTLENTWRAIIAACGGAGTGTKITAQLEVTTAAHNTKGGLYDATGALLTAGATDQVSVPVQAPTDTDFAFTAGPTVAVANYYIMIWSVATSGQNYLHVDADATKALYYAALAYNGLPDPLSLVTSSVYIPDLFVTYTPSGGWANIAKVNSIASASIAKVSGVAVASIAKIDGVAV